jgi:flavin reductase (DIM6/NTAB) family NADH-FMN oxidoreductase RutF
MKRSLGPRTLLYPHPVLLVGTFDDSGRPNLMTAAWGGICCSRPPCVAVSIRASRHSHAAIVERKAFTVGVPSVLQVREADFVGLCSGAETDKFAKAGFTPVASDLVDAPYAAEIPLVLECRLLHTLELGIHTQFIGEILDVKCEEDGLDPNGIPDIERIRPFLYAGGNNAYYAIGDWLADAFEVGKELLGS